MINQYKFGKNKYRIRNNRKLKYFCNPYVERDLFADFSN